MVEIFQNMKSFLSHKAWGALDIAKVEGASIRVHWTDKPYIWHQNDGAEVFVILDGIVDMHYRENGEEKVVRLKPTDIFTAERGDEHIAKPVGEVRILVIEKSGSI